MQRQIDASILDIELSIVFPEEFEAERQELTSGFGLDCLFSTEAIVIDVAD